MIAAILSAILLFILFKLFISGLFWKIIAFIGGIFGITIISGRYVPETNINCLIFNGWHFSWAQIIAISIVFLAMLHTKSDE